MKGDARVVSPVLTAPLASDVSLGLVWILFERVLGPSISRSSASIALSPLRIAKARANLVVVRTDGVLAP